MCRLDPPKRWRRWSCRRPRAPRSANMTADHGWAVGQRGQAAGCNPSLRPVRQCVSRPHLPACCAECQICSDLRNVVPPAGSGASRCPRAGRGADGSACDVRAPACSPGCLAVSEDADVVVPGAVVQYSLDCSDFGAMDGVRGAIPAWNQRYSAAAAVIIDACSDLGSASLHRGLLATIPVYLMCCANQRGAVGLTRCSAVKLHLFSCCTCICEAAACLRMGVTMPCTRSVA